jgi:hypothetical protein
MNKVGTFLEKDVGYVSVNQTGEDDAIPYDLAAHRRLAGNGRAGNC